MGLINTDGLVLIGPGSEWFWSMLQFVVVAVTLLGIYYQLRVARSANAFDQLGKLVEEWEGERLIRHRLGVLSALRDGAAPAAVPESPASAIANYWEKVGALVHAGHIDRSLIAEGLGGAQDWWGILAPFVMRVRADDANPAFWEHFEWLAGALVQLHPTSAFDPERFDGSLEQRITSNESDLRALKAIRTVILASPGSTAPDPSQAT